MQNGQKRSDDGPHDRATTMTSEARLTTEIERKNAYALVARLIRKEAETGRYDAAAAGMWLELEKIARAMTSASQVPPAEDTQK